MKHSFKKIKKFLKFQKVLFAFDGDFKKAIKVVKLKKMLKKINKSS